MMDQQAFNAIIAENMAKYRKAANLTQSELAERLNYSDKSISKWEQGNGMPDIFVLYKLAELYGVTVNDFFYKHEKHALYKWASVQPFDDFNYVYRPLLAGGGHGVRRGKNPCASIFVQLAVFYLRLACYLHRGNGARRGLEIFSRAGNFGVGTHLDAVIIRLFNRNRYNRGGGKRRPHLFAGNPPANSRRSLVFLPP